MFLGNVIDGLQQTANPSRKIVAGRRLQRLPVQRRLRRFDGHHHRQRRARRPGHRYRASPVATRWCSGDELRADPAQRYSYVFEGNARTLDHAVVNRSHGQRPGGHQAQRRARAHQRGLRAAHHAAEFSLPYRAEPPLRVSTTTRCA